MEGTCRISGFDHHFILQKLLISSTAGYGLSVSNVPGPLCYNVFRCCLETVYIPFVHRFTYVIPKVPRGTCYALFFLKGDQPSGYST